jgi:beta-lactamase regulating signal transducer with metallopeptidase domain
MIVETILAALLRINLVASVAILLVLLLRPLVLRWLGAGIAYWLWLVVAVAAAASFLPPRERIVVVSSPEIVKATPAPASPIVPTPAISEEAFEQIAAIPSASVPAVADALVILWLLGAAALLVRSIVSTRVLAADPSIGPALVGVFRPRLVLPADFETRFDVQERTLILAHEEVHRVSGHTVVNALVEVARCASWFNPLVHLAANLIRTDQELACDAAVIAAHPSERQTYARALLKTQLASAFLPLGCVWMSRSGRHLRERIAMLGRASLDRRSAVAGAATIVAVALASGYAAWAQQPERRVTQIVTPPPLKVVQAPTLDPPAGVPTPPPQLSERPVTPIATPPKAVWTPMSGAPAGLLTALEGGHHDRFIERAQAGDIDIVFFGTTETEMWHWPDRGRSVWDSTLGRRKAANFGSQGTRFESLLWRMQNGELDGYHAKLVVLHGGGIAITGDQLIGDRQAEFVADYARLIAEIRVRQPQAKILLSAPFPRGQLDREQWRAVAEANAAVYRKLADEKTIFYVNFGERFFLPDGSHDQEMWRFPPRSGLVNVGTQTRAFEVWAEELTPWLDRFGR